MLLQTFLVCIHQMKSFRIVLLLLSMFIWGTTKGDPRSQTVEVMCGTKLEHNTTAYVPNFIKAMENIGNQISSGGLGLSNVGTGPDANYGLGQCYGDLSSLDCVLCYAEARTVLPKCFPYSSGRIYLDGCFMRSENYSFFMEYSGHEDKAICGNKTKKSSAFDQLIRQALSKATNEAPTNGGYAKTSISAGGGSNESAYVLANCWKILNESSCQACLRNATASVVGCLPWSEGRALNTGCFLRYSDTNFLNPDQSRRLSRGSIIALVVAVGSATIVMALGFLVGIYTFGKEGRCKRREKSSNYVPKMTSALNNSNLNFKYSTLEKATEGFAVSNKLGQGGYGTVYKGVLADGREVAVKRLFFNTNHRAASFYNEVNMISNLAHKNLMRLLGCSSQGPESLLVYEYLENKSLDHFLFDGEKSKVLDWRKRFNILIGTAEGLSYLHENSKVKVIHRDIKASNILLDRKFQAKIADFGLARSFHENNSHISTVIAGTLGYMAPEYIAHGKLTEKADAFSFGVLMMEIVTGRSNSRGQVHESSSEFSESLFAEVWRNFQSGSTDGLIDPNIIFFDHYTVDEVKGELLRVLHVGLLCTQDIPSLRPSVSQALQMLLERYEQLPEPSKPPFTDENTMELTCQDFNSAMQTGSVASVSTGSFYPR